MLKKVFNGFMLLLNIGMSALLLLACLLPYISVALVPSMSIFSLRKPVVFDLLDDSIQKDCFSTHCFFGNCILFYWFLFSISCRASNASIARLFNNVLQYEAF